MNVISQLSLSDPMHISVLGEIRVDWANQRQELPSSRKARALLAYLVMTGRTIRRERLCELFWDVPNDPRASLRWALSKLRLILDTPGCQRLVTDRERVAVLLDDVEVDFAAARRLLSENSELLSVTELQQLSKSLAEPLLDGLDGVGGKAFDAWLMGEREDARLLHGMALRCLATHRDLDPFARIKWAYKWLEAMPFDLEAASEVIAACRATGRIKEANAVEDNFRKEAIDAFVEIPSSFGNPTSPKPTGEPVMGANSVLALTGQSISFCRSTDDINIAYATAGLGPPLVKASGWLSHLELDWGSPIWGKTYLACAQERQLIRYDGRGSGLSDRTAPEITLDACVRDLEAVVDTLGLERFPLLGLSCGCPVSIEYAARHPDRVSGLILMSGFATGWRVWSTPEQKVVDEALLTLVRNGWEQQNPAYRQIFSQTFMPDARWEEIEWFNEFQRKTTSSENAARFLEAFGDVDLRDRLSKIEAPTIVFHSKEDQYVSIDQGRSIAIGIPNAEFVPLESRNHILLETEPAWNSCLKRIASFLTQHEI